MKQNWTRNMVSGGIHIQWIDVCLFQKVLLTYIKHNNLHFYINTKWKHYFKQEL